MAIATFGVDAEAVRGQCFPSLESFSGTTAPTLTVVTQVINEQAARVAGRLLRGNISAATINSDPASGPYAMCAYMLKIRVAVVLSRVMTGVNSELVKAWKEEIKEWNDSLESDGAVFLGDPSLQVGEIQPAGPSTHLNFYGLSVSSGVEPSSIDPIFTRDDVL